MVGNAVVRLYQWWLASLSDLLTSNRPPSETWRTLLEDTPDGLHVYTRQGKQVKKLATLPPDADDDQASVLKSIITKEASSANPVLARISEADALLRTVHIPQLASDVIAPVLANQMERLVPWPEAETKYGYHIVGPSADQPDQLDVEVVATNKGVIDGLLRRAEALGLTPVAVDFSRSGDSRASIELVSLQPKPTELTAKRLAKAFAVLLFACLAAAGYGIYEVWSKQSQVASIEADVAAARTLAEEMGKLSAENDQLREQRGRLARKKTDEPAIMILVEALSRALPDSAYLTDLEIEGREVRFAGKSENATALITILEESPQFENVRFSAPTTREPTETVETFSIIAHAEGGSGTDFLR